MPTFTASQRNALESLAHDLEEVFGGRLRALVAYAGAQGDGSIHSCAVVDALSFQDLARCLPFTGRWHQRRVAVPLMLSDDELQRTLDIFPLEYAAIAADHAVVRGDDPFAGLVIPREDLRRATEALAKSHLIHLREAFLESHGETTRVAQLVAASAGSLRALLQHVARLHGDAAASDDDLARMAESRIGAPGSVVREVLASSAAGPSHVTDPAHLLSRYIAAAEQLWNHVDGWHA